MSASAGGQSAPARVAFLVQRVGPYHEARLRALATRVDFLTVVEYRPLEQVYSWDPVADSGEYARATLPSPGELETALERIGPQVIVCVGYSDPEIHRAIHWARARRIALVVCSDSTYGDEPRRLAKELIKRILLSSFDAALVAGARADAYLHSLGVSANARFRPWDVVDNAHFARGAAAAREEAVARRAALGLPCEYFFCSARFVPKKNLAGLLEAYRTYVDGAGASAWSLVLAGGGPEEPALRAQAEARGLAGHVRFAGFVQYLELPAYYGLAGAAVLPSRSDQWGLVVNEAMAAGLPVLVSRSCGCADDLVRDSVNGFAFDPQDRGAMARALQAVAGLSLERRAAMGDHSRRLIQAYSPEAFAEGLLAAIGCAGRQRPRRRLLAELLAGRLARRPIPAA